MIVYFVVFEMFFEENVLVFYGYFIEENFILDMYLIDW